MRNLLLSVLLILSTACSSPPLSVRIDSISVEMLASTHVYTPDPRQYNPRYGEQLVISWHLDYLRGEELALMLRFRNGTFASERFVLTKEADTLVYSIEGDLYETTGGIAAYLIQLLQEDNVICESRHALWANIIAFPEDHTASCSGFDLNEREIEEGTYYDPATDLFE